MSTVTTTKPINQTQLTSELGAGCTLTDDGTTRTVAAAVTQAALQAAVDAHVAIDEDGNRATLQQQATTALQNNRDDITTNDTYLAITAPTNAQVAAQVKALTQQSTRQARELNGIIRLVLNKLDGTT